MVQETFCLCRKLIFCLDVYLLLNSGDLPTAAAVSLCHAKRWQKVFLDTSLRLWSTAFVLIVSEIYPQAAYGLMCPAQDWMFVCPLPAGPVLRWPRFPPLHVHTRCTLSKSVWLIDSEHTITSRPADSLFALTQTETDTRGPRKPWSGCSRWPVWFWAV